MSRSEQSGVREYAQILGDVCIENIPKFAWFKE